MISQGAIALSAPLDTIKQSHRSATVRFSESRRHPPSVAGVLRWDGGGREWTAVYRDGAAELRDTVATWGASIVTERVPSLDEIFVAHVGTPATSAPQR